MLIYELVGVSRSFVYELLGLLAGVIQDSFLVADYLLISLDLLRSLAAKLPKKFINLFLVDDDLGLRKRLWLTIVNIGLDLINQLFDSAGH